MIKADGDSYLKGQDVNLTKIESKIQAYLAKNSGRIIAPQYILEKVWGQESLDKQQAVGEYLPSA
ncbi:MAG TPA: winged helix-turn-helix domain-containing protein [Dehalococcoidales bacterium]